MTGAMARVPLSLHTSSHDGDFPCGPVSFSDVFFGYMDDGETSPENSCNSGDGSSYSDDDEDDNSIDTRESRAFWNSQDELLQATLRRTSSIETKIRRATKDILRELSVESSVCDCRRPVAGGCRSCWQREICNRLRIGGFNCAICKSKWRNSSEIPSGEHSYLEVVDDSNSKRGEVRVVIELNFRAEFEMARGNEEYKRLIGRLPEIFVGKRERLWTLVKVLCSSAKRCAKEKKMHLAPWRKHQYMQSKWSGKSEKTSPLPLPVSFSDRPPKPKASLLTFDLLDGLPRLHRTAVEVV